MKIRSICMILPIVLMLSGSAIAQLNIEIIEEETEMSQGFKNGYSVVLPTESLKDVEKELRKRFATYKGKVSGNSKTEIFFDDANIKALSENTTDVYVKLFEVANGIKLNVFYDLGGTYLNSAEHSEKSEQAKGMLRNVAIEVQRGMVEERLKDEEKKLEKRNDELKSLIKDNEKYHDKISQAERDIERLKKDIADNELDQERSREDIQRQKDVVSKIEDALGPEKEMAEKTLKNLEKDKKKLIKDNEKMHQKIEDNENDIAQAERDIETNLKDQEKKKVEIEEQKEVVTSVQLSLSRIK